MRNCPIIQYGESILVEEIKNIIIALGLSGQVNLGADEPRPKANVSNRSHID
jgi:hypothetical protein